MNSEKNATNNMMKLVGTIFATALVLAGAYFFVFTPQDPQSTTIGDAERGTQEQHSR